jgi:23S rRNA pseudouridine1911/1915/1917 synthase
MGLTEGTVRTVDPVRFDRYFSEGLKLLTRSQLKARFVTLRVNGKPVKLSRIVEDGDRFALELLEEIDRSTASLPEAIPLSILYEDDDVIVIDKPQGMVVHPAHGNWSGTLANALLGLRGGPGVSGGSPLDGSPPRAGIVHRLDKDTSGVIIAGKTAAAQEFLAAQFRERTTSKTYIAIVSGRPPAPAGRIDDWLARDPKDRKRWARAEEGAGKRAVTEWRVVAEAGGYSILSLSPKTGRTHQLRVHCKGMACPIVGDPVYGRPDKRFPEATLLLHALELRILLPGSGEPSAFRAPVPERFHKVAAALGLDSFPEPRPGLQ